MLPSVVTTNPMVECSVMTLRVPISAARLKGISSSYHGVFTMRGALFSMYPSDEGTIYPTQSIILTLKEAVSSRSISIASSGMNFGSVVMMVRPAADWGISSVARSTLYLLLIFGITSVSINCLMKVDFPVLTGPMTPIYISPPVRSAMSL